MAYNILGKRKKKKRKTDRRAGRVPHVKKQPRSRVKSGRWRKKRKDTGKKKKRRNIFDKGI